ncbi:MAG: hypothetical protein JRJ21_00280 [Deltaproteobacteria bacterium]|nr:hypothetical protein [Deltaproteobacteria bacterium]
MGLNLIFGVLNVVNLGHGAFVMIEAFIAVLTFTRPEISLMLAISITMIIGMVG